MTMYDTGISWGRAKPHLKTGAMRADRHLGPEVHSFHPMGLGQDWLKWEIVAKRVSSLAMTATMRGSSCPRSALRSTFPGLAVRHLRNSCPQSVSPTLARWCGMFCRFGPEEDSRPVDGALPIPPPASSQ